MAQDSEAGEADEPRAAGGKRAHKDTKQRPLQSAGLGDVIKDHLDGPFTTTRRRDGKTISMDPVAKIYAWLKPAAGRTGKARQQAAGRQLAMLLKTLDQARCREVIGACARAVCGDQPLSCNGRKSAKKLLIALNNHPTIPPAEMASLFADVFGMSLYFQDRFLDSAEYHERWDGNRLDGYWIGLDQGYSEAHWIGFIAHYQQLADDESLLQAFTAQLQHGFVSIPLMRAFVAGLGGADRFDTWGPHCVNMMVNAITGPGNIRQAAANFDTLCRALKTTDGSGALPLAVRDRLEAIWFAPGNDDQLLFRTVMMREGVSGLSRDNALTELVISVLHALFRRPSNLNPRQMANVLGHVSGARDVDGFRVWIALAKLVQQRTPGAAALFVELGTTPSESGLRDWRGTTLYPGAPEQLGELFAIAKPGDADSPGYMAFLGDWCARCELAAAAAAPAPGAALAPAPGEANTLIKALLERPQLTPTDPALLSALFTGYASHLLRSPDRRHAHPALHLGVLGMTGGGPLALTDDQATAIAQALGALAYTEHSAKQVGHLLATDMALAKPERRELIAKQFAQSFARNPQLNRALARGLVEGLTQNDALSPGQKRAIEPLRTALRAALGEAAYTRAEQESIAWDRPARTDRTSDSKSSGSVMPPSLSSPSLLTRLTDLDTLDDSPAALPDITPRQRGAAALFMQVLRAKRDLATSSSSSSSSAISGPEPDRQSLTEAVTTVSDALATSIAAMAPEAPLSREALLEAATNFQRRALPGHTAADWLHDAMAFGWRIGLQHLEDETYTAILNTRIARLWELFKVEPWDEQVETDPVLQGWINVIAGSPGMQPSVQSSRLADVVARFACRSWLQEFEAPPAFQASMRHLMFRAAQQLAPNLASHVGAILRGIPPGELAQEILVALAKDLLVVFDSDDVHAWLEFAFTQEANETAQVALRALLAAMESRPEHADYFVDRSIVLTACSHVPDPRGHARELVLNCVRHPGGPQSEARVLIQAIKNFGAEEMEYILERFTDALPEKLDDARTAGLFATLLTTPLSDTGDRDDALTIRQLCKLLLLIALMKDRLQIVLPEGVPGELAHNRRLFNQMFSNPQLHPVERLVSADAVGEEDMIAALAWGTPVITRPLNTASLVLAARTTRTIGRRLAAAGAMLSIPQGLAPTHSARPFADLRRLRISFLDALRVRDDAQFPPPGLKPSAQGSLEPAEHTLREMAEFSRRRELTLPLVGAYVQYIQRLPQYAFLYAPAEPSIAPSSSSSKQGTDTPAPRTHDEHQDLLALLQFLDEEIVVMTRPQVHPADRDHLLMALGGLRAPVMSSLEKSPLTKTPGAGKSAKESKALPLDR